MRYSVTSSITWRPHRFSLTWADTPEEVPVWDFSRNAPLGDLRERSYYEKLAEQDGLSLEAYLATLNWEAQHLKQLSGWESLRDPPRRKEAYPRLVCAEFPELAADIDPPVPVCEAVAGLARWLNNPAKFKREVLRVASRYSLYDYSPPDDFGGTMRDSHTLVWWQRQAKKMRFFLELARSLSWLDEDFTLEGALDQLNTQVPDYARYGYRIEGPLENMPYYASVFGPDIRGYQVSFDGLEYKLATPVILHPTDVKDLAHQLFQHFWTAFEKKVSLKMRDSRLYTRDGWGIWSNYELALAFRRDQALRSCKNCGSPFFARRKNQNYCDAPGKTACKKAHSVKGA